MMLVFTIAMVAGVTLGVFSYVSERSGLPWLWASLTAGGYVVIESAVCLWVNARPIEYFLNWFPTAGLLWLGLMGLLVRIRFRGRSAKRSA